MCLLLQLVTILPAKIFLTTRSYSSTWTGVTGSPQSPLMDMEQKKARVKMSCLLCFGLITTRQANNGDTRSWKISRLDKLLLINMRKRKGERVGGEITAGWKNVTHRQKLVNERTKKLLVGDGSEALSELEGMIHGQTESTMKERQKEAKCERAGSYQCVRKERGQ